MCAIQMISAQIGRVTGRGLAGNMRRHYPAPLLYPLDRLLLVANTINIGADLGAMAAALRLLIAGPQLVYVAAFAIVTVLLEVFMRYSRYAVGPEWLTLSLFAYVATVFVVGVPWRPVARNLVVPHIDFGELSAPSSSPCSARRSALICSSGRRRRKSRTRRKTATAQAADRGAASRPAGSWRASSSTRWSAWAFRTSSALFIMLTTAATLNAHGVTDIQTSSQAAEALRPIAGRFRLHGLRARHHRHRLLAVPVLAGSAAYAVGEALRLARRSGAAAEPGARLLRHDRRGHPDRRGCSISRRSIRSRRCSGAR